VSSKFKHTLFLFLLLFILYGNEAISNNHKPGNTSNRFKEITKEDITLFRDIKSTDITVFGLYLSMKLEEIVREINQYDFLYVEKDVFNENRLYVYDDKGNDMNNTLAYLILDENTFDLKEIVLYPAMIKYLIGNSKKLLTLEMINQNSDIVKYFTGIPQQRKKILDIPSLHLESYTYYYPTRNFVLTKNKNDKKIQLSLSLVGDSNF
jgi:hypothetical protein